MTDNATRVSVEGITQLNSPCWTNFFVRSNDVSFDDVFINAYSTNASVSRPPGTLSIKPNPFAGFAQEHRRI